jgi:hypothetical protein
MDAAAAYTCQLSLPYFSLLALQVQLQAVQESGQLDQYVDLVVNTSMPMNVVCAYGYWVSAWSSWARSCRVGAAALQARLACSSGSVHVWQLDRSRVAFDVASNTPGGFWLAVANARGCRHWQ